jgi:hypothetical protein
VRRADVEALIHPALSREQLGLLWLNDAIVARFLANPAATFPIAEINLRRLRPDGPQCGHGWTPAPSWAP